MRSFFLRTAVRVLLPLLLLFSIYLFLRGHNEPGGGFVAGLTAAAAWSLYAIAFDSRHARAAFRVEPRRLIATGLLVILASGLISTFSGRSYLSGIWFSLPVPGLGDIDLGTPVLFDLGVFMTVIGVTLGIVFSLEEVEE